MRAPRPPRRACGDTGTGPRQTHEELDYFNALACLCVILIHVLSLGISTADPGSWQAAVVYFPWRLCAYVVPAFLFSGGVKLSFQLQGERQTPYRTYLLGRVRKIYVPYLLWTALYYLAFLQIHYVSGSWREFFSYLLAGNLSSQFYYVLIVMQFYLLRPLWAALVRRVPWCLALCCCIPVMFFLQKLPGVLALFHLSFPYTDRIFLTYLLFWVMGLYAGKYYPQLCACLLRQPRAQWLSGAVIVLCAGLAYAQYAGGVQLFDLDHFKIFSDCLSIFALLALCLLIKKSGWAGKPLLQKIHRASYFVYLSHCLFLTVGTDRLRLAGVSDLGALLGLRLLIGYSVPFALYALLQRLRKAR